MKLYHFVAYVVNNYDGLITIPFYDCKIGYDMLLYIKYILKWVTVSMNIVLASKSPRRKELLSLLDLDFEIITADIDETMDSSLPVTDEVARISYQKADAVAGKLDSDTVVISADTIVELDGIIMGKPKNAQEAMNMLSSLSGKSHNVHTAVTVLKGALLQQQLPFVILPMRKSRHILKRKNLWTKPAHTEFRDARQNL